MEERARARESFESGGEIFQLKMAVDIRLASCKRSDQNPLLEAAVFYLLLYTGLRESELVNLNFDQYKGDALLNIRRKGQRISKKIVVPKDHCSSCQQLSRR